MLAGMMSCCLTAMAEVPRTGTSPELPQVGVPIPGNPPAIPPRPKPAPAPAPRIEVRPAASEKPLPVPSSPPQGDMLLPPPQIEWREIARLPPAPGFAEQPGLAGAFAGAQGLHLIIAGGANYAAGQAWDEAPRAYWNQIYVLEKERNDTDGNHQYHWVPAGAELPQAIAYGASISVPEGLLCIGGRTVERCYADCLLLHWNEEQQKVDVLEFPRLPVPLANHAAVKIDNMIYVMGGRETTVGRATNDFYMLDLSRQHDPKTFVWQKATPWDGAPRIGPLAAVGSDNAGESLYLCGGRNPGGNPDFLSDLHRFDPRTRSWAILGSAVDASGNAATLMSAPTFFVPPHHLVVVGGTDEHLTALLEDNARRIDTKDPAEAADRKKLLRAILENFPGYSRNVMAFDIIASEWSLIGTFPERPPVATSVVNWDLNIIIPGGETGPGQRTAKIWQATVKKKARVVE